MKKTICVISEMTSDLKERQRMGEFDKDYVIICCGTGGDLGGLLGK